MHRYLIIAIVLAACAAQPTTSSTSDQPCQRDPVTGGCKSGRDPGDAQSVAAGWVTEHYANATVQQIDCGEFYEPSTNRHGYECATGFSWWGTNYIAGCLFFYDGDIDCDVEETD